MVMSTDRCCCRRFFAHAGTVLLESTLVHRGPASHHGPVARRSVQGTRTSTDRGRIGEAGLSGAATLRPHQESKKGL